MWPTAINLNTEINTAWCSKWWIFYLNNPCNTKDQSSGRWIITLQDFSNGRSMTMLYFSIITVLQLQQQHIWSKAPVETKQVCSIGLVFQKSYRQKLEIQSHIKSCAYTVSNARKVWFNCQCQHENQVTFLTGPAIQCHNELCIISWLMEHSLTVFCSIVLHCLNTNSSKLRWFMKKHLWQLWNETFPPLEIQIPITL
jgi:hypothetical protein